MESRVRKLGERNALPWVLETMAMTHTAVGWGLDESACLVCEDGVVRRALGKAVYRVVMRDFAAREFTVGVVPEGEIPPPDS